MHWLAIQPHVAGFKPEDAASQEWEILAWFQLPWIYHWCQKGHLQTLASMKPELTIYNKDQWHWEEVMQLLPFHLIPTWIHIFFLESLHLNNILIPKLAHEPLFKEWWIVFDYIWEPWTKTCYCQTPLCHNPSPNIFVHNKPFWSMEGTIGWH